MNEELKLIDEMLEYFTKEMELKFKLTSVRNDIDDIKNRIEGIEKKFGIPKHSTYKERSLYKASELYHNTATTTTTTTNGDGDDNDGGSHIKKKSRQSSEVENNVENLNPKKKSRKASD